MTLKIYKNTYSMYDEYPRWLTLDEKPTGKWRRLAPATAVVTAVPALSEQEIELYIHVVLTH